MCLYDLVVRLPTGFSCVCVYADYMMHAYILHSCRLTGKQLWKFAVNAIRNDIQQKNWRCSPKFVIARAHQNVEYVKGYVQYLTKSSVPKEVKVHQPHPLVFLQNYSLPVLLTIQEWLAATEDDQSFEELYLLRQLAMNEVKQQRGLAEVHLSVIFVIHIRILYEDFTAKN